MTPASALAEPASANGSSGDQHAFDPIDHTTFPYRFDVIEFDRMFVDHAYQRRLTALAKTIAAEFDPALVGTFIVNQRRNRKGFAVIDGQTRLAGMTDCGLLCAPCVVFEGMTRKQEAALFAKLQSKRRNITTYERFRASYVAEDPVAVAVVDVVTRHGFTLSMDYDPKNLRALGSLESAYRKDPELLDRIMYVLATAWPQHRDHQTANGTILTGLDLFLRRNPDVDVDKLARKLGQINPEILTFRAKSIREGTGKTRSIAGCMNEAIAGVLGVKPKREGSEKTRVKRG